MGSFFSAPKDDKDRMIVFVEGNIGSGKSTLIENLQKGGYPVWNESVDEMCENHKEPGKNGQKDETLIELFYSNFKKYAFALQIASFNARWNIIQEALRTLEESNEYQEVVFVERSLITDVNVFASSLHDTGMISDIDYSIYKETVDSRLEDISKRFEPYRVVYLYLKTEPEECKNRISIRGRSEEANIGLPYLQSLHEKHEKWLNSESAPNRVRVLRIDGSEPTGDVYRAALTIVKNMQKDGIDIDAFRPK